MKWLLVGFCCLSFSAFAMNELKIHFEHFDDVTIYGSQNREPTQLILFLSGDGGWNLGVIDMAKAIADMNNMVVGINTPAYLKKLRLIKEKCHYPAADLESLSHYLQKKLQFPQYVQPTLVGYSSGATLAYATLAQAPSGTFRGAISLGFCPDLPIDRPLCKGSGLEQSPTKKNDGYDFHPFQALDHPWIILHGEEDQVCNINQQKEFVAHIPKANLIALPKVGHGFSVIKNWMPQFKNAISFLSNIDTKKVFINNELKDLPIIEVKSNIPPKKEIAIILSGDGGWASIDKELSKALAQKGINSIGLDSLRYFWKARTPEILTIDLKRIADHYLKVWGANKIIWIGYSMGADVLPFALSNFPKEILESSTGAALLGLSDKALFEFHLSNWLSSSSAENGIPIAPELKKISTLQILCINGADEKNNGCNLFAHKNFKSLILPGGHHFGGDFELLAREILSYFKI